MEARPLTRMTEEEYLAFENASLEKHEYVNGEVLAMAGGTNAHALVSANITRMLGNALRGGPCVTLSSDARVHARATSAYFYPDVSVVCGSPDAVEGGGVRNPTLVVEVLSPSTEEHDRGAKLAHYRRMASVQCILLVSIAERRVEHWTRTGDAWTVRDHESPSARVEITEPPLTLACAEMFENVERFEDRTQSA